MSFSNRTRWHSKIRIAALAVLTTSPILPALAQESPEESYHRADALYHSGRTSDAEMACNIMKQVVQEAPTNQIYQNAQRTFCNDVQFVLDKEKTNAKEGIQLARSGKCNDAKAYYDRIAHLGTRSPTYRDQLRRELDACQNRPAPNQVVARQLDEARQRFQNGKDDEARALLQPIASSGGPLAQQARQLLARVDQAEGKDHALMTRARTLVSQGRSSEARSLLQEVIQRSGPDSDRAQEELDRLVSTTSDKALRAGIRAYFNGDLTTAEHELTSYLSTSRDPNPLAFFFRGAERCSRFFLLGGTDIALKNSAAADFQAIKQKYKTFPPPLEYISPKIRDLYAQQ